MKSTLLEEAADTDSADDGESEQMKQHLKSDIRPNKGESKPSKSRIEWLSSSLVFLIFGVSFALLICLFCQHSTETHAHKTKLTESFEKYSYGQHKSLVRKNVYGSPDLLSTFSEHDLETKWLGNAVHESVEGQDSVLTAQEKTASLSWQELLQQKNGEDQFVVVFDAGSTGTRLHVFQFQFGNSGLELVEEFFQKTTPGLSEYVHRPGEGAASLKPMIDAAMERVPPSRHKTTPLVFKATAGFRLLSTSGAHGLLVKVREQFASTDFRFNPDDIGIMGGTDEGLFGWITVNFLLGKLGNDFMTVAALDLGGASLQITYEPRNPDKFATPVEQLNLLGMDYSVYTHSYLGMGMFAARNSTLQHDDDGLSFTNDCLPKGYQGTFTFGGTDYQIRGPAVFSQDACWQQVGQFLVSQHTAPQWDFIEHSRNPDVYLFSYFYDTLQWAGVLDGEEQKTMSVQDFFLVADQACKTVGHIRPFLCQDLTYVTRLLGEIFMLWDRPLHVVAEINSGETSWALGAALDALFKEKHRNQ